MKKERRPVDLEVILPVYNEVKTIEKVVSEWHSRLVPVVRYRFIICEDGSTDGTSEALRQLAKRYPIRLIQKKTRQGYGPAVFSGILAAVAPYVFCADSDGQYDPADFSKFWQKKDKSDVIIGWRKRRIDPLQRRIFSGIFKIWFRTLFPTLLHDPSAPFVLFRRKKVAALLKQAVYLHEGFWWGFVGFCLKNKFQIKEMPIRHRPRLSGTTKVYLWQELPRIALTNVWDLVKIKLSPTSHSRAKRFWGAYAVWLGLLVLLVISGIAFSQISVLVKADQTPPHWDYALHLTNALNYWKLLSKQDWLGAIFYYWFYYPPLTYLLVALLIGVFGYSEALVVGFNLIFWALLLAVVLWFTRKTLKLDNLTTVSGGFLLLGLVLSGKTLDIKLWEFMLDFPLGVLVVINYCLFSNALRRQRYSLKSGLILGTGVALALLTKWTAAIFLIVPLIYYLFSAWQRRRVTTTVVLLLVPLVAAGWWYFLNYPKILPVARWAAFEFLGQAWPASSGWGSTFFYIRHLLRAASWLNLLIVLLVVYGFLNLIKSVRGQVKNTWAWFDLMNIILPWFFLAFVFTNKEPRYFFPIYLLIFLLIYWCLALITRRPVRTVINLFVVVFAISQVFQYPPSPATTEPLIDRAFKTAEAYSPKTVGYFFENDAASYNFSNITLRHVEREYFRAPRIDYIFMNSYSQKDKIFTCDTSWPVDIILVYFNQKEVTTDPEGHASFTEICPENFRRLYQLIKVETLPEEALTVYQRRD